MIDQDLITRMESDIVDFERPKVSDTKELLKNYKSLVEQNTELHKELAAVKGDRVFVCNGDEDEHRK